MGKIMNKTVWKFGCRWDDTGAPQASIAPIFLNYGIVFAYTHAVLDMNEGDLIMLADGENVIAIGEALTPPAEISKLKLTVKPTQDIYDQFFDRVNIYGGRVKYYQLGNKSFTYKKRSRFCRMSPNGVYKKRVNDLFDQMSNTQQDGGIL